MIENLIIIIPTHNRQHYLRRVIRYYSSFPCKVFICDSSKKIAEIESCENIIYRWVPQSNFYRKVLDVINETPAEYYALSPDDDFLKQETLMECYNALNADSNYYVGLGRQVFFSKKFDGVLTSPEGANLMRDIGGIDFKNNWDYAKYFETHYQNVLWSLYRRHVIKSAFECLAQCNFMNGNFVELILGIETLRRGKVFMSEKGLNYREVLSSEHWGSQTLSITKENIEMDRALNEDVRKFYRYYNEDNFVVFCLNSYLNADFHQSNRKGILYRLKSIIPESIKCTIKRLLYSPKDRWDAFPEYKDDDMSILIKNTIS